MKRLIKKLSSCVLPGDQLLPLIEDHIINKPKQYDQNLPWVEVVKRLLTRAADEGSEVLFENASTIIKMYLTETVKKGLKNPRKFGQKYSDILNSLLTHLHFTMEEANLQVAEMNTLSSLILAAVIDMIVAVYKKGEESSAVANIFMKLTMILGHSQELLLDALFHCKTLIHPRSRQPLIQVPLIKRLFSSIRSGQTMTPVVFLKYLLLGKLWLFMSEKKELGKTRTYIAKILKLPGDVPEWAEKERVPWLELSQWNTRLILKNMTLLGALETFYGDRHEAILEGRECQVKKGKSSTVSPVKIKTGSSKSHSNKNVDEKVKTGNNGDDDDVKMELQIINISDEVTDEETLPCSSRTNESIKKDKKKRKAIEAVTQKEKKRKIQNHLKEETDLPISSKTILPQKIKSGSSKSCVNKNVRNEKIKETTCHKITKEFPEVLITEGDSEENMKEEKQIPVEGDNHVDDEKSPLSDQRILRKGDKRKSVEVLERKGKKGKIQNHKEDKETNATSTSKADKITVKKKPKTLGKKCKRNNDDLNNSNVTHVYLDKTAESDVIQETEPFSESVSTSHPVEEKVKASAKSCRKKSRKKRKALMVEKEYSRDEVSRNKSSCDEVSTCYADEVSLEALNDKEAIENSRKQKLLKKQQKIRRKSMTFTVTELEVKEDDLVVEEIENDDSKNNEELNVNEVDKTEAVCIVSTEEQTTDDGKIASRELYKEINCNNITAIEDPKVENVSANKCNTGSENGSDEDNNLENNKTELVLENSTSCRKEEENLSQVNSDEDQTTSKDNSEHFDPWNNSSEYSVDSVKVTLVKTKWNMTEAPENDPSISHKEQQHDSFKIDSDADSISKEVQVNCIDTEDDVSIIEDGHDVVVVENGSNEMKEECSTDNRNNVLVKENNAIPINTSEKLMKNFSDGIKGYENVTDEESDSEGELIITEYSVHKLDHKYIKTDNNTEEETVTLTSSDQDGGGKDDIVLVEKVEGIEHCKDHDEDEVEDSKISNTFHDVTIPESECETKVTPDCDIIEALDTNQAIISSKETDKVPKMENILEEVKPGGIKTSPIKSSPSPVKDASRIAKLLPIKKSPSDAKDKSKTTPLPPCKRTEPKRETSQDPVSRMMNNFYKSIKVKVADDEKERDDNDIQNSKILNGPQNATPQKLKDSHASTSNAVNDTPEIIVETVEIDCLLENIAKDTGRPSSIHGLRERLLSETLVKEEQTQNTDHVVDGKESSDSSKLNSHSCVSKVITADPPPETPDLIICKPVEPVIVKEDTDSLVDSIVKDENRLADIRGLREELLCKPSSTETKLQSSECEVDITSKEATKDNETSCHDSQVNRAEENPKSIQLNDEDEALLDNDTLSSDTVKEKDGLKDEPCIIGVDKHLENSNTENCLITTNDNEAENDDSSKEDVTRHKDQETSNDKHFENRDIDNTQTDKLNCITSYSTSQENGPVSTVEVNPTEENSQRTDTKPVETNEAEGLTDLNVSTDGSLTLVLKASNAEEIESVIDESIDKSTEGADEAYEASSDASEDVAPRTRRRSRSLRKLCAHQELHLASDSDSSPVRAARCRPCTIGTTNCPRPKRKRSQSYSLDSVSSVQESHNSTQNVDKSANRTYSFEEASLVNETYIVKSKKTSYPETSIPNDINCHSNKQEVFVAFDKIKQDLVSAESDETVIGESLNYSLSSEKTVVHDTTNDATESSIITSSQDSQDTELRNEFTFTETSNSLSSDSTATVPFNVPSSPSMINTDDASQAELSSHSKVEEDPESCMSPNERETTLSKLVPSNENSLKSQDCATLTSEEGNQNSLSDRKESEIEVSPPEILRTEEHNTSDNAGPAQDVENESKHEEIRKEIDQSDKHIDNELNQERTEQIFEGEEIEVLSTSGIEEEDEREIVGVTPETFDDSDEARKEEDLLISKRSLRSHIRHLYLTKDGKDVNSNSGFKDCKLAQIPLVKAQCLSEVALTKEVLISPDVSDEEYELVSSFEGFNGGKSPIEEDHLEDGTARDKVSLSLSNLNLQKSNGGINSPHKTIPEEQDESTIPKSSSVPKTCTLQRSKTLTISPTLSISSTDKLDDRNIRTRNSSRGMTSEGVSGLPQNLEVPNTGKSNTKVSRALSNIQEEYTDASDPESILDTSKKLATENTDQERKETVTDTSKDSHDSPSSREKECNGNTSASQEMILLSSQNQNCEPLCEDSDPKHKPERCKDLTLLTKNNASDASQDTVVKEDKITQKSPVSSLTEEKPTHCDTPRPSLGRLGRRLSSSSSSPSSLPVLAVRRSSRLRKQPTDISSVTKDSRSSESSNVFSENERELEEQENKRAPGSPKTRRRSVRCGGTSRKASSDPGV